MSLVSKTQKIRDALLTVQGLKCYHLKKPASVTAPYAVWQEDQEGNSHYADNAKAEQVIEVTIDYYTKTEYDTMIDSIQDALNTAQIAWKLNSFQYEDETKLMHYEWLCEVI
jgi:hypothetical protein